MLRAKRNSTSNRGDTLNKKQRTDVVKRSCNEFYPKHASKGSNYGVVKELVDNNKDLYP